MLENNRINYILLTGFVLVLIAALIVLFLNNFELIERETRDGVSKEARRNPFLAAEIFLKKTDTEVESVSGRTLLHNLPSIEDILLINNFGHNLSRQRYEAVIDWIKQGGHLITTAKKPWDVETSSSGDQLLDQLGVQLITDSNIPENSISYSIKKNITSVSFETGEVVNVIFNPRYQLNDTKQLATSAIASEHGIHLLQIPLGDGLVTVMSDNEFLTNPKDINSLFDLPEFFGHSTSIAEEDHAYYLWLLVGGEPKVWILYSLQTDGIAALLWKKARLFCLSLIALLIIWLWWQYNRFGPRQFKFSLERRNYLEHIKMSANYSWKQDKGQRLFQTGREQFMHWLSLKHPQFSKLSPQELTEKLSEISQISTNLIFQALFGSWKSEREFIQLTYTLQTLRKQL